VPDISWSSFGRAASVPRTHDYRFLAEIGRRLTAKREELGLSQQQAAGLARISPQQLSKYEFGLSDPPISTLMRITAALKMSPTALLIQCSLLSEQDKTP
jgi:transcriptional regulator with XRE-family HTH domain